MPKPTPITSRLQGGTAQAVEAKAPKRNSRALTPQIRSLIAQDCKARGTAETAKIWEITFGLALEIQIERLERIIEAQRERIAAMERKVAA